MNKAFVSTLSQLEQNYDIDFFVKENKADPYRILISCVLSLRTKDEVTFPATRRLFDKVKNMDGLLALSYEEIEKLIYPVGFYKTKAKTIYKITEQLKMDHKGMVPDNIDQLLNLHGVGRKTANLVVSLAFGKPGICVDVHVHRIVNRMGFITSSDPLDTEMQLRDKVPQKYWRAINGAFVRHGQEVCKPKKPLCEKCNVKQFCKWGG